MSSFWFISRCHRTNSDESFRPIAICFRISAFSRSSLSMRFFSRLRAATLSLTSALFRSKSGTFRGLKSPNLSCSTKLRSTSSLTLLIAVALGRFSVARGNLYLLPVSYSRLTASVVATRRCFLTASMSESETPVSYTHLRAHET